MPWQFNIAKQGKQLCISIKTLKENVSELGVYILPTGPLLPQGLNIRAA